MLTQLAADYDTRHITLEAGRLYYSRDGMRARTELVPITDNIFALGDDAHAEFVHEGGRVRSVRFLTPDGQAATAPRTK